jgi:hypothetical protein
MLPRLRLAAPGFRFKVRGPVVKDPGVVRPVTRSLKRA